MTGVVIVHYGDPDDTIHCIRSINQYNAPLICVIDNQGNYPTADIREPNIGYGAACNIGFELLSKYCSYVIFLNNDTLVFPGAIKYLTSAIEDGYDIVCPMVVTRQKNVLYAGGRIKASGAVHNKTFPKNKKTIPTEFIYGCCIAMRVNVFEKLGGFDGSYFLYCEDLDLSMRAALMGMKTGFVPSAVIMHKKDS